MIKNNALVGPLYLQVAEALRGQLLQSEASKLDPLPSEIDLAAQFNVSIGTMRKALEVLVKERMIERRRGRGTFLIPEGHTAHATATTVHVNNENISVPLALVDSVIEEASVNEARKLSVQTGGDLIKIRREGNLPNMVRVREVLVVPKQIFPDLEMYAKSLTGDLHRFYATTYGVSIQDVSETVSAINADENDARLLSVDVGTPILRLDRISTSKEGQRVEWSQQIMALGQAQYLMKQSRFN